MEDHTITMQLQHFSTVDLLRHSTGSFVHGRKAAEDFDQYIENYIRRRQCYGKNAFNETKPFVPRSALDEYWTNERIDHILWNRIDRIKTNNQLIKPHFLVTFSILVSLSRPEYITMFMQEEISDRVLPLSAIPTGISETEGKEVFEAFEKNQWKFCPFSFDIEMGYKPSKRKLSPYRIIPVKKMRRIDHKAYEAEDDDDVCLYRVELHEECFSQTLVLFKTFNSQDVETKQQYENEVDMYSQLVRPNAFDRIIEYYGSFESLGLCTIILEYAEGGTLQSFFEDYAPPHSQHDRELFWRSLAGLLNGLEHIHNPTEVNGYSRGALILKGTHQDIRPKNILNCNSTEETHRNVYDVCFKLVDMGTCYIRRAKYRGIDRDAKDQWGNGMYSAPEAYRDYGDARGIRGDSDVWALGGIASEAFVWSIWGEFGRTKYQQERVTATRATALRGGFHEGAFHDGDCLLSVVEDWHQKTIDAASDARDWYSKISRLILDKMLEADPGRRADASTLVRKWGRTIHWRPSSLPPPPIGEGYRDEGPMEGFGTPSEYSFHTWAPQHNRKRTHMSDRISESSRIEALPGSNVFRSRSSGRYRTPTISLVSQEETPERPEMSGARTSLGIPQQHLPAQRGSSSPVDPTRLSGVPWGYSGYGTAEPHAMRRTISETGVDMDLWGSHSSDTMSMTSDVTWTSEGVTQQAREDHHYVPRLAATSPNQSVSIKRRPLRKTANLTAIPAVESSAVRHDTRPSSSESNLAFRTPPVTELQQDRITIDTVWTRCLACKRGYLTSLIRRRTSTGSLFNAFPQLRAPINRLRGNDGRDQIFLVDDSMSMRWHQQTIARACRVLTYVLKAGNVDPNRMFELYFTSSQDPVKSKSSLELQTAVENHDFMSAEAQCDMASSLDLLVAKVLKNSKPVSIYVLTNGHWNLDSEDRFCGVDKPIKRLLKRVSQFNLQRNWFGVQFVRFYDRFPNKDDDKGKRRLMALDDELEDENHDDIVDTVDFADDLRKILIGAISPDVDKFNLKT